jgi:hypothetical protein
MNFKAGDILKRRAPVQGNNDIGVVLDADATDDTVEVLQFDQDGPFTTRLNEHHTEDLFEVDNG